MCNGHFPPLRGVAVASPGDVERSEHDPLNRTCHRATYVGGPERLDWTKTSSRHVGSALRHAVPCPPETNALYCVVTARYGRRELTIEVPGFTVHVPESLLYMYPKALIDRIL